MKNYIAPDGTPLLIVMIPVYHTGSAGDDPLPPTIIEPMGSMPTTSNLGRYIVCQPYAVRPPKRSTYAD